MPTFSIYKDPEDPRNAGADGLFQIITIKDNDGIDITHLFDQGVFYRDDRHLAKDISLKLGIAINQIDIIEE